MSFLTFFHHNEITIPMAQISCHKLSSISLVHILHSRLQFLFSTNMYKYVEITDQSANNRYWSQDMNV